MNSTHPCRFGLALVEVIISAMLMAGVLALLYLMHHGSTATASKLDSQQEALRSALLAIEVLTRNLKSLVTLPVDLDTEGLPRRRYGDHVTPVKIGPLGRTIAFYVSARSQPPGPGRPPQAITLTYSLWPGSREGTYQLRQTQGPLWTTGDRPSPAPTADDGAAPLPPPRGTPGDHVVPGILLADLRCRLLEPGLAAPARRSPDEGYYLQILASGVDLHGRRTRLLPATVRLEYPSLQRQVAGVYTSTPLEPTAPLETPPGTFVVTPEEADLVRKTRELSRQFAQGRIDERQLERGLKAALEPMAGRLTSPILWGTAPRVPHFADLSVRRHEPTESIDLADSAGNVIRVALGALASRPADGSWWIDARSAITAGALRIDNLIGVGDTFGPLAMGDQETPGSPRPLP